MHQSDDAVFQSTTDEKKLDLRYPKCRQHRQTVWAMLQRKLHEVERERERVFVQVAR